jgi:hypothetical protein
LLTGSCTLQANHYDNENKEERNHQGSYIETSASALKTANAKFYSSAIIQCSAQIDHQTSISHIDTNTSTLALDKDSGPIANTTP